MKLDVNTPELIEVDGHLVERDALKIAEALKRYDENLEILCIDPSAGPNINEAPFLICERCSDGQLRRVFEAWQLDDRILQRVYSADQRRFDTLEQINRTNAEVERANLRRYQEQREESKDLVAHIAASRKSDYSFKDRNGEHVTIREDLPFGLRKEDRKRSFSGTNSNRRSSSGS
jgi:hypothetical protein